MKGMIMNAAALRHRRIVLNAPVIIPMAMAAAALLSCEASAQSVCTAPLLGTILCTGDGTPVGGPVLDVPAVTGPLTVRLGDGFISPAGVSLTTIGTAANVLLDPAGTAVINAVDQPGLNIVSGGGAQARITSIATSGTGATGALLRAVDDIIFTADGTVSTVGDAADAIDAQGRSVTVNGNVLRTVGNNANGAELVSTDGPVNLNADLIETAGSLSNAVLVRASGPVGVDVGVLRTSGSQALGLDIATNPGACILLGNSQCSVTAAADQITTNGFGGIGALVTAVAPVTVNVGVLQTGGDQAAGLNLVTDPAACATLGVGQCDQGFTVNQLTTQGNNSPGALVRGAGNITGNVSVLRTNGNNAAGLDLASDPAACATLGAGACGTSFNLGQLTTSGVGATGVLARVAGPTRGRVDILQTLGDNSPGIDLGADPTACALIGSGACDVDLAANSVSTAGDGAAAVLVNAPGNILANLGVINTSGNNSPGLGIITDPVACLALGPGSCGITATTGPVTTGGDNSPGVDVAGGSDPVIVTTGPVTTGGDNSPGVEASGTGPVTVTTGNVTTTGDNSPGVDANGGAGPVIVTTGNVSTSGDDSPGVGASGTGPITVGTGTVTTGGDRSDGVNVAGGEGPIVVMTGPVSTTGAASDGIDVSGTGPITIGTGGVTTTGPGSGGIRVVGADDQIVVTAGPVSTSGAGAPGISVTTTSGNQTINAGPVTTTGPGANGIDATATGCATVTVNARGPIASANGTGIAASSACAVVVTTNPGAPVAGRTAGINAVSGTGATITIGDVLSSSAGPALNVDGAPATVLITPTGSITGAVDLTPAADRLTNNGTFIATADSAFGGGTDTFINNGSLIVRPATPAGGVTMAGLESLTNSGLIDLRNGVTGTTLTIPGSFNGSGASTLAVDASFTPTGAAADRLIVGGAATGSTQVVVNSLTPNSGTLVNGVVVVDAGAGSSAAAFTLAGNGNAGFVSYSLAYDPATSNFSLFGVPSTSAYELLKVSEGARQLSYQMSDAWSGHMQAFRDGRANGANSDDPRKRGHALWGQAFGAVARNRSSQNVTVFGQSQTVVLTNRQDFYGGQIGYDFGDALGQTALTAGVTAGYGSSDLNFRATPDRIFYDAVNVGAYFGWNSGMFFVNGLAKYEHYFVRLQMPSTGTNRKLEGDGFGGTLEAGLRWNSGSFFLEPSAAVDYSHSNIGGFAGSTSSFDLASANGVRGRAGGRIGTAWSSGVTTTSLYASAQVVHEFTGRKGLTFTNAGQSLRFANDRLGTYAHGAIGISIATADKVSGFIEASGDTGADRKGFGGRAGINVRF
jgi:outer membrane autotransporter protein